MQNANNYSLYKHTCPNGKVYIGITRQEPLKRWKAGQGYTNNEYFYRAITKYGWDNIHHEILFCGLSKAEAEEQEVRLIALHKSNDPLFGYNIANGGNAIGYIAEETRQKISDTLMGHTVSAEAREKIRRSLTGRKATEETRQKLSEIRKGKCPNKGYKWSNEQKERLRKIKRENPPQGKCVAQISNGEVVNIFRTISEAAAFTGCNVQNVSAVCNGKRKTTGGFAWRFL